MEPGTQRIPDPEATSLLDQDQEGGLESVQRVVRVGESSATDAQDHRPMPLDQGCESQFPGLTLAGREPLEQLPVRQVPDDPHVEEGVDLPSDGPVLSWSPRV